MANLNLSNFYLLFFFIFTLISFVQVLKIEDTKIATTRNKNQENICSYSNKVFTREQRQKSKQTQSPYQLYSPEQQIRVLSTGDFNTPNSKIILMVIPHVVALATTICLIFGLFCCIQWPETYPKCRVFRDPNKYVPQGIQLRWPAYASLITFLVIIVGSLIALVSAPEIINDYNNVGCKNATMIDDTLNGRLSVDNQGNFFVGLLPLKSQLQTFKTTKISTFFSESSNSFSTANLVKTKQNTIQTTNENIYTNYVDLSYNGAFSVDGTTFTNTYLSDFKTLYLGPTSNSTKILGNIKTKLAIIFNEINLALDSMIDSWNNILSVKTQAGVTTQINNFNSAVVTLKGNLESYLNEIGSIFYNPQQYDLLQNLMKAFYGMTFAFSLIGLAASIWMDCCNSKACRPILYVACFPLMFLVLIGLCALTYVAFYYPQIVETCYFVDKKLQKGADTKSLLNTMGMPKFADIITSCMKDGSGKIINQINPSFSTTFDYMNVIARGVQQFNEKIPSYTASNIDAPFTQGKSITDKVRQATIWQISDQTAKNHVSNVVGKNYTINNFCNLLNVQGDVWMPSFSLYSCPGGKAKMSPCSNLGDKIICPLGCYEILNTITSPSGDSSYMTTLQNRYNSTQCNYYDYIKRLHQNWNIPRSNRMNSVDSFLDNLKTVVNDYTAKVDSQRASINSFKTALQSNLDSMTNLDSGSFNGMDCRIISQSIWQFRDSVCIGLIESMKTNIISLCLICYGILLMSCFATCAGVRNYKALKGQSVGDKPSIYHGQMIPSYNQLEQTDKISRNQ